MNRRQRQLYHNLDSLFAMYANGISDHGEEEYPLMTEEEAIKYAIPEIYHMKDDGCGCTFYGKDICKDLRFLGREYIEAQVIKIADECGVLK